MTARILVVEDEAISAMAISMMLESSGHIIIGIADTGEHAIELAAELLPDMVLMDVRLKGDMSGIESGKAIKARLHIPVIIMTAYTVDEIRTAYDLSDDFLFLTKPIQENLLTETVSIAWEQSNNDSPR